MHQSYDSAKPYTRWWWFNSPIRPKDVRYQLDWLKRNGFGGVEIAFMYSQPGAEAGPEWLSPEWSAAVADAKQYAESIGLGCDFTFCSAWPFGGSIVDERDASRTWGHDVESRPLLSRQRLEKSWEDTGGKPLYVLNHLDRHALERYSQKMGAALKDALVGATSRLFCDSFEVEPEGLWSDGLDQVFFDRFGYDLRPFMSTLDEHPDERYDYRRLISDVVLEEFYRPFTDICHRLGALSRVQCLGTPTDLLAAYCAVDVPESEALLFDPHFSQFAASASAVADRRITSAESFTCLYGWKPYPGPGPHQGQEQIADIKLLADALFANGINSIVWHGMPYNPQPPATSRQPLPATSHRPPATNHFYASVHVGPDSSFAAELPGFNRYLEQVSTIMRQGRTYSDVAVYLPLEDNWMQGRLPPELRRPSAEWCWELQYERFPEELLGFRPLWVSMGLLKDAEYRDGKLRVGNAEFNWLYVDVEWLDASALRDILRLAKQGLPVVMRRRPTEPGKVKHEQYESDLRDLLSLANVRTDIRQSAAPLLSSSLPPSLPEYWCRVDGDDHIFFFAHPASRNVHYPMRYGQSVEAQATSCKLKQRSRDLVLDFPAYGALVVHVSRSGKVRYVTPDYMPQALERKP